MDGDKQDIDSVCESLQTIPLFPVRKVILLKGTAAFQSKETLPDIIKNIKDCIDKDPSRACRNFLTLLRIGGWKLNDFSDEGWKRIPDEQWQSIIGSGDTGQREDWIPKVVDLCIQRGMEVKSFAETDRLSNLLKSGLPEENHLILTAEAVDRRKALYKIISELGVVIHFPKIKGEFKQKNLLQEIASRTLLEHGKSLSKDAWQAIGRKTGFNLRAAMGAIEQIVDYTGDSKVVEEQDIEEIVGKTKESTVFDLTTALVEKDLRKALVILEALLKQGVNHVLIHSLLAREIRMLIHAKIIITAFSIKSLTQESDYNQFLKSVYPNIKERLKTMGLQGSFANQNPYAVFMAMKNSTSFSLDDLKMYLQQLVDMDITFKSTSRDPRTSLEQFIINVCSS
jgi:DNA polymerase III subunit delta